MDVKPTNGMKVRVNATREAVFGEDGVEVRSITPHAGGAALGVMTGRTLVGFTEVEMAELDGKKHWYPVDQLATEKGEKIVEEELPIDVPADEADEEEPEIDEDVS